MKVPTLNVAAITSSDPVRNYTWHLRVAGFIDYLRDRGIHVVPHRLPSSRRQFPDIFAKLTGYDLVWLHRRRLWGKEMRGALKRLGCPIVLDIDDPIGFSASAWQNLSLKNWLQFRTTAKHSSAIFAASEGLVRLAKYHNPNVHLLRLSADVPSQRMATVPRRPGEPLRLLWLGARSTFVYLEGIKAHLEAIGRQCPNARLLVVGHEKLTLQHLPVENLQWSKETELHALATCHVGLVPLKVDRWTQAKASFKPLQYLSNGMPFIGTPVGINHMLADGGKQGLLPQTPAEWAQPVALLEADEALRLDMGTRGIAYIQRHHATEVLGDQIAHHFWNLCAPRMPANVEPYPTRMQKNTDPVPSAEEVAT